MLGFESNLGIIGDIEKKNGEYRIYISPGEQRLNIWGPNIIKYIFHNAYKGVLQIVYYAK